MRKRYLSYGPSLDLHVLTRPITRGRSDAARLLGGFGCEGRGEGGNDPTSGCTELSGILLAAITLGTGALACP